MNDFLSKVPYIFALLSGMAFGVLLFALLTTKLKLREAEKRWFAHGSSCFNPCRCCGKDQRLYNESGEQVLDAEDLRSQT